MSFDNNTESVMQLERLMKQYGTDLLRLCAMVLKDAELARDAVQDTFIRAYGAMDKFRGEASEKTYLTAIAMNVCRDYLKSAWSRHKSPVDFDRLPEEASAFTFPDDTVLSEVMSLPRKYREVVLLRFYEDMKLGEIAAALHCSIGRVRTRLNRANSILKEKLKEWYCDEAQ